MATFKISIRPHHIREDGTVKIKIQVTHQSKQRYLTTNFVANLSELVKKTTRDKITGEKKISYAVKPGGFFDESVRDIIKRYRAKCNIIEDRIESMSVDELVNYLTEEVKPLSGIDFIAFAREYILKLQRKGQEGSARNYKTAINALIKFWRSDVLSVEMITTTFLQQFQEHIEESSQSRAPSLYLGALRTLHKEIKRAYNQEDRGIIRIPFSPFNQFTLPKAPKTKKRAIAPEIIKAISELPDVQSHLRAGNTIRTNLARDCFILSFCLIGINSTDLYHCPPIRNGRLIYKRKKTANRRSDEALIEVVIQPEILYLVDRYADPTGQRAFRFHLDYRTASGFNKAINKGLNHGIEKKKEKLRLKKNVNLNSRYHTVPSMASVGELVGIPDLEYYAARHSWATIARNDCRINKYVVHDALNHVDPEMKVTEIYLRKDFTAINEANRTVLDYIFKKPEETNPPASV